MSLTITDDKGGTTNPSIVTVTVKASEQPSLPTTSSAANETIFINDTSIPSLPNSDQTQLEASTEYSFVKKWGSFGTGDGQFNGPVGIATDSSGNVFVDDLNNQRIQKFDNNGNFITKWGSYGYEDGQFSNPD